MVHVVDLSGDSRQQAPKSVFNFILESRTQVGFAPPDKFLDRIQCNTGDWSNFTCSQSVGSSTGSKPLSELTRARLASVNLWIEVSNQNKELANADSPNRVGQGSAFQSKEVFCFC